MRFETLREEKQKKADEEWQQRKARCCRLFLSINKNNDWGVNLQSYADDGTIQYYTSSTRPSGGKSFDHIQRRMAL